MYVLNCYTIPKIKSQTSTTSTNPAHAVSTWPPHSQDAAAAADRPHTISTAYEKGHQRPPLTVYTFQSPEINSEPQKSPANVLCRPPLPIVSVTFISGICLNVLITFNFRLQ